MKTIKACVIGASGYTGTELLRLLLLHPNVIGIEAVSKTYAGKKISDVVLDLTGSTDLQFVAEPTIESDVYFLCLPHGESKGYLQSHPQLLSKKLIDLSRDFRSIHSNKIGESEFVYGLPELNKEKIKQAKCIANPGCFATAIQLALLPLAKEKLINNTVVVNAITGSTGAGTKPSETTHFSWRQNNHSVYQAMEHAHNEEIMQSVKQLQTDFREEIVFLPQRGSFTRGIFCTAVLSCNKNEDELYALYENYYADHAFTHVLKQNIDLKMAVNSNNCFLHIEKKRNQLMIVSIIDNLLKGASGQAVQNMNLMFGLEEKTGLLIKNNTY